MMPTNNRSRSRSRSRARVVTNRVPVPMHENKTTKTDPPQASQSRAQRQPQQRPTNINSLLNSSFIPQPSNELRRGRSRTRSRAHSNVCGGVVGRIESPGRNTKTTSNSRFMQNVPAFERDAIRPSPCPSFCSVSRVLPGPNNTTPSRSMPLTTPQAFEQFEAQSITSSKKRPGAPISPNSVENYGKKSLCVEPIPQTSSAQKQRGSASGYHHEATHFQHYQTSVDATNDNLKSASAGANSDFSYRRSLQSTTIGQPKKEKDCFLPDVEIVPVSSSDQVVNQQPSPSAIAPTCLSGFPAAGAGIGRDRKSQYVDTRPARRIPLSGSPGRVQRVSQDSKRVQDGSRNDVGSLVKNGNFMLTPVPPKVLTETCEGISKTKWSLDETQVIKVPGTESPTFPKTSTPINQTINDLCSSNEKDEEEGDCDNGILDSEIMSQTQDGGNTEVDISVFADNDKKFHKIRRVPVLETITSSSIDVRETKYTFGTTEDNFSINTGANQDYTEVIVAAIPDTPANEEKPVKSADGNGTEEFSDNDEFMDASEDLNDVESKPTQSESDNEKKRSWCSIM